MPSAASFVTVVTSRLAGELAAALQRENLFVLPFPLRGTPGALRITIGSREDNDAVVNGLRRALTPP